VKEHSQVIKSLAIYHDLDEAGRREIHQHIQHCAACAERLAVYQSIDWDLARLSDPRPDERLREVFYASVGARDAKMGRPDRLRYRLTRLPVLMGRALELAVLLLLVAALGFVIHDRLQVPMASSFPENSNLASSPSLSPNSIALPEDMPVTNISLAEAIGYGEQRTSDPIVGNKWQAADLIQPEESASEALAVPVEHMLFAASPQRSLIPETALAQSDEAGRVYTVQLDDTLWRLSEKYLGDGRRYGEIVEATNFKRAEDPGFALIEDPNLITPGSRLWIPAEGVVPSSAEPPKITLPATTPLPTVSGLGGRIAFSYWNDHPGRCTYEISVIDVAACLTTSEECQATRRVFSLNNASEPALSPGGGRLAFRGWGDPPSEASPYLHCAPPVKVRYLANTTLDGAELRGTGGFWEDSHPDWSPDGQQILFDSKRHEDRIARIFLVNADGSDERDLRLAGEQPGWAPDGQRFVYRGCDLTGNRCGLWLAYAAPVNPWEIGANMIGPLVQDDQAAHPDWSPVSDQIVYQSPAGGSWDLYVVNADGTEPRQLTNDPAIEGLPAWSPDGQWIAYLSDAGGNWGIWVIRGDGGERHLLFPFDGGIFTPQAVEPYGQRDWVDEQISWSQ
jgi:hypothetical protein